MLMALPSAPQQALKKITVLGIWGMDRQVKITNLTRGIVGETTVGEGSPMLTGTPCLTGPFW